MDNPNETINSMLCDWYKWARGYQYAGGISTSPMFREVKAGRQWDTVDEIITSDLMHSQMEALDHIIMSMRELYRTSLQIYARNLYTGQMIWSSARLPTCSKERATILGEARHLLTCKLSDAGML